MLIHSPAPGVAPIKAPVGAKGERDMSHIQEINRVVERAKRERANYIGSAVQAYAVPVVLVAGLSLMLLQFSGKPPVRPTEGAQVAQVTASTR